MLKSVRGRMTNYIKALYFAALEAYEQEVVYPDMEESVIGEHGEYTSKKEWLESKMTYWLEAVSSAEFQNEMGDAYSVYWFNGDNRLRWSIVFGVNQDDARMSLKEKVGDVRIFSLVKYE